MIGPTPDNERGGSNQEQARHLNEREAWTQRNVPLDRHSLYRKIDEALLRRSPGRVLEVGCETGRYLEVLKGRGWSVAGIELQPQDAEYVIEHDAAMPFPFAREFDVVIAAEVIEHIVDTDTFLRNCAAVLKPAGLFLVTTPNLVFGVNRVRMLFGRRPLFAYADFHVRMFVWDDLESKISRHFRIRRVRGSHVLVGTRHARVLVVFAHVADIFPKLAAHFIVEATPLA